MQAIEHCKVFLILLSHASLKSQHVINELLLAYDENKHLVPVVLEPVKLSHAVKLQLAGLQQVSFHEFERIELAVRRLMSGGKKSTQSPADSHRHLLAVMFTDIQGFSLIMNTDESLGMETLHFHNDFMRKTIESSEGRVVEIIGDGILSVFESAVRAVGAGIAIQEGLKEHNMALPEEKRFLVRVGIHMGDIIEESGGVKGDAVNIASRIQAIAPGGGIAISETVYDAVRHKMPLEVVSLGAKKLKNIQDPYTIYTLKQAGSGLRVAGSPDNTYKPFDLRPSTIDNLTKRLAVIPFEDQSPNHDNEWFGDGLTDDLISTLNKLDEVFVLDRQSSKEYRNSRLNTKQIAQELAVRYIITGSVRKHEKDIRVQATLIDTETGKTLWDEKFPGTMDDIFDIQEKTAKQIADGLKLKLTPEEKKEIEKKLTENAEAYELYKRAIIYANRQTKQDLLYALDCLEEAVKFDPVFGAAYALISRVHTGLCRYYKQNDSHLTAAREAIEKARQLNPELPIVYSALSDLHLQRGESEEAIRAAKKMIELDPKNPASHRQLGVIYSNLWQPEEVARHYEEAIRLDPTDVNVHFNLCLDYDRLEDLPKRNQSAERALPYYQRYLKKNPDDQTHKMCFAILLEFLGRKEESLRIADELISAPNADGVTIYNCACMIVRQGEPKKAIAAFAKAAEKGLASLDALKAVLQ